LHRFSEHSMGLFCVNFHFRTNDDRALSLALNRRGVTRQRVVPGKNGWTALYEEQASEQDDRRIRELGKGLSGDVHAPAIAFLVHDSDIACYWLFEDGNLLDEYNSDPDYFRDDYDGPKRPSGGRTDVLVRYCRPGTLEIDLARILAEKNVRATIFAEHLIERLAKALGIDPALAIADYRHAPEDGGPGATDGFDDDGDDDDGGPRDSHLQTGLMERLAKRYGFLLEAGPVDPQARDLVQAAARGDVDEIDRLLAQGAAVDAEGPAPLPRSQAIPGLAELFPGGIPEIAMTPLLAAIVNKQHRAAERLLDRGADPSRVHPRWGTAVHAATGAGDAEMLQILLDRGADSNARSAQGQTPLEMLAASRTALDRLAEVRRTVEAMGINFPRQMPGGSLPPEGWDDCERLLKAREAR
jgi:hypothetical protein